MFPSQVRRRKQISRYRKQKEPINKRMDKEEWYTYVIEYYSTIKKNEI